MPVACDFSRTTWVEPVRHLKAKSRNLFNRFVNILVTGAIAMEARTTDAPAYNVLLKAVENDSLSGSMVSRFPQYNIISCHIHRLRHCLMKY